MFNVLERDVETCSTDNDIYTMIHPIRSLDASLCYSANTVHNTL